MDRTVSERRMRRHPSIEELSKTSEERKQKLFEKHYGKKIAKKAKTVKQSSVTKTLKADANAGRFKVALEDTVFDVLLGDSGADFSFIDITMFKDMISKTPGLLVRKFDKPLKLAGAFNSDDGTTVFSSCSVILTITVYIPVSNIPVRVRGVEFFVVDESMDKFLLGRPFLPSIWFNLECHLVRVRDDIHNKHVDDLDPEVQTSCCKVSRFIIHGRRRRPN